MNGCWTMPESLPTLADDKLQLWRIDLGSQVAETQPLLEQSYAVLTAEERERAARMRAGGPREEFVAGRGCLRRLLGAAMHSDPAALTLEKGRHGKPILRSEAGAVVPAFNVAHSGGVVLIGLSFVGEVGVDVEFANRGVELYDIARTAFHVDDVARVERAGTPELGIEEFYRCWTRKEAVAKADGRGLSLELTAFAAGSDSCDEDVVTLPATLSGQSFFVREIDVGPCHRAALATLARNLTPHYYMFPSESSFLFAV